MNQNKVASKSVSLKSHSVQRFKVWKKQMDDILLLYYWLTSPSGLFAQRVLWWIWIFFPLCSTEQKRKKKGQKRLLSLQSHLQNANVEASVIPVIPVIRSSHASSDYKLQLGKTKLFIGKVTLRWESLRLLCPQRRFSDWRHSRWDWLMPYELTLEIHGCYNLGSFFKPARGCAPNLNRPLLILTLRLPGSLRFPHASLLDCSR